MNVNGGIWHKPAAARDGWNWHKPMLDYALVQTILLFIIHLPSQVQTSECSPDHIRSALSAMSSCEPREVVVQIPWPNNTDIQQMTPSHVLVRQCSGGCTDMEPSCLPSKTKKKQIPILVAKCGITLGICDKECATVEIEEHVECKCACALSERDCSLPGQHFSSSECACRCEDREARIGCLEAGHWWQEETCTCACVRKPATISRSSTGADVPCIPQDSDIHNPIDPVGPSSEDVNPADVEDRHSLRLEWPLSLEMMVIVFLLSLILVLFTMFLCLACKLRSMKIRARKEREEAEGGSAHLVPSTLSGAYLSSSDPCSDLKHTADLYKEQVTDSSACSSSHSDSSVENQPNGLHQPNSYTSTLPTNYSNLAIRTGTLNRSSRPLMDQSSPSPTYYPGSSRTLDSRGRYELLSSTAVPGTVHPSTVHVYRYDSPHGSETRQQLGTDPNFL